MKKVFLLILLLVVVRIFSQVTPTQNTGLVKDPFFNNSKPNTEASKKVQHKHSDVFGIKQDKYEGNPVFSGNVVFEHQGSVLTADEVVLYQKENFLKAIGNVVLTTADGSKIIAEEMEYDGNTERGIARRNVVLTDPKQTIKTETLYYDKIPNTAYFNTGGTIYSNDGSVMYTKAATYYLNTKMIDFIGRSNIETDKYTIVSDNIKTNQVTGVSDFFGPTTIRDKANLRNYVYTELGTNNSKTGESFLNKNSRIHYNDKILTGDKLYFNRNTGFGKGNGNVMLEDPKEKRFIKGGYGEIYEKKDSAMVTDKPYAVKILTKDSVYISAEKFLTYQKPDSANALKKKSFLRAFKKVRIYKTNMQGRSDSLSFNETDGEMHLIRKPILWMGVKQVTGDEIRVYSNPEKEITDSIRVLGNAFAISKVDSLNMKDEFHQIKSKNMIVYLKDNAIDVAKAVGNAQAINYADDENEKTHEITRIGVALSTCGEIAAQFLERRLEVVDCNIGANTDTYPMSKISKDERFFKDFNWNTKDRPQKWRDIFLDTPNYPETVYQSDNSLFERADAERKKLEEKNKPKVPIRVKK
ncbi:OstA-like protein [Epilithonimonas ginsengisoli]|uniref:OstA-like protein n=1 Tax=Epilithonimonas ginsengisoli TaxID=1245592 RepID=A0ABU4JCW1_9FLAO|nr:MULTISPECIES: OstA-like protein [Chryseobacterium group]MBV6878240.1 organic solvent tolerance protein OstA [Epilithonimonas sp. FP105]MDW8547519.1 OstA-like protein [Epilithonimonas ginsengisoli]OAH68896.1 organic solvent tolerance protein OstA [Chryseobacterium sp. FP211-J200]